MPSSDTVARPADPSDDPVLTIFEAHFRGLGGCDRYQGSLAFVEARLKRWALGLRSEQIEVLFGAALTHINYPTFRRLCERLAQFPHVSILETGSSAHGTNSSALFARIAAARGGRFLTVDLNPQVSGRAAEMIRQIGGGADCAAICGDSVATLRGLAGTFNVVYLDSYDLAPEQFVEAERHGLREFHTLLERGLLDREALILVDDTPRTLEIFATQADDPYLEQVRAHSLRYGYLPGKGALIARAVRSDPRFEVLAWDYQLLLRYAR